MPYPAVVTGNEEIGEEDASSLALHEAAMGSSTHSQVVHELVEHHRRQAVHVQGQELKHDTLYTEWRN